MSAYNILDAKTAAKRLRGLSSVAVLIHKNPDGDAVGSAAALCCVLNQLGAKPYILSPDKIPDRLKFILEYTGAQVADKALTEDAIAIDVASPLQLGSLAETAPKPFLMIDHHEVGIQFADGYIIPGAASASEALFDIVEVLVRDKRIKLTKELAYALYAATSSDTGCFAYSNATARTHALASKLIATGIDTADINHRLFNSKSPEQIKAEGYIASVIKTAENGKIGYATLTLGEMQKLGLFLEHFETAIDVVRTLRGIEVALLIKEIEAGSFKASMRSTGANVAQIASKFGGGGHVRAAGFLISVSSIEEALNIIIPEIEKAI